jgi:hypothetical protein
MYRLLLVGFLPRLMPNLDRRLKDTPVQLVLPIALKGAIVVTATGLHG